MWEPPCWLFGACWTGFSQSVQASLATGDDGCLAGACSPCGRPVGGMRLVRRRGWRKAPGRLRALAILRDALGWCARQTVVWRGLGRVQLAWSLTLFPHRHTAFFDHTYNLPLQLIVELGLCRKARAVLERLAALGAAGGCWWRPRSDTPELQRQRRAMGMLVLMIGVHSLLEPLWYAYFLLPAVFAFGLGLPGGGRRAGQSCAGATAWAGRGPLLVTGSATMRIGTTAASRGHLCTWWTPRRCLSGLRAAALMAVCAPRRLRGRDEPASRT